MHRRSFLLALIFALPLWSQAEDAAPQRTVAIVGASLSGGFNAAAYNGAEVKLLGLVSKDLQLKTILGVLWETERAVLHDKSSVALFQNPRSGFRQLRRAARTKPDLLIGLDFPFWFGYGLPPRSARVDAETEAAWRLDQQEEVLAALDEFTCPMVLGDYPDLTNADRRMIPGALIPTREVITELNTRLHAWAKTRPKVVLVPLASQLKALLQGKYSVPVAGRGLHQIEANYVLQWDRMHPTNFGMACLGVWMQDQLRNAALIKKLGLGFEPRSLRAFATATKSLAAVELLEAGKSPPPSKLPKLGGGH